MEREPVPAFDQEQEELIQAGVEANSVSVRRNGIDLDDFARLPERGTLRRILLRGKIKRLRYIVAGNLASVLLIVCDPYPGAIILSDGFFKVHRHALGIAHGIDAI